jgi:hypothetical protein
MLKDVSMGSTIADGKKTGELVSVTVWLLTIHGEATPHQIINYNKLWQLNSLLPSLCLNY